MQCGDCAWTPGNLYVPSTGTGGGALTVLDPDTGGFPSTVGTSGYSGIAIDASPDGTLFMAALRFGGSSDARVVQMKADGTMVAELGEPGIIQLGQFQNPLGLSVIAFGAMNRVYVADKDRNIVQVFEMPR